MRIGVDLKPFYTGSKYRGIGVYSRNLIQELLRLDKDAEYHFLNMYGSFPDSLSLDERCFVHSYEDGPMVADCGERSLFCVPELTNVREAQVKNFLKSSRIDTMLFTSPTEYGNMFHAEWFQSVHTVAILYDLIPLIFPDQYLYDSQYKESYMASLEFLKKMDCLLAISQSVKDDAVRLLNIPQGKIRVIFSGLNNKYLHLEKPDTRLTRAKFLISGDYFLFAGGIDFKKNIEAIIHAYVGLNSAQKKSTSLVITGKAAQDTIRHYEDEAARSGAGSHVICTGFVSDEELVALYCGAKALVFPSLYEGFGLPVIEAMACGIPVITSNCSSLKEIAQGHAILVNPKKQSEIREGMENVLKNPEKAHRMAQEAEPYAKQFTWALVAKKAYTAMRELLDGSAPKHMGSSFRVNNTALAAIAQQYNEWAVPLTPVQSRHIAQELRALERGIAFPAYPCGKRILYDVTVVRGWLENQYSTGIGRVSLKIYEGIRRFAETTPVAVEARDGKFVFHPVDMSSYQVSENTVEPKPGDVYFMPEYQVRGVQIPADHPHPAQLRAQGIATYAVLYDILPLQMPQYFEKKTISEFGPYVKGMLADYDGILSDSRAVSDALIAYVREHSEIRTDHPVQIGYFHLGMDTFEAKQCDAAIPADVARFFTGEVFLMVGTIEPRKGHSLVLDTFENLWREGSEAKLCFIGHAGWNMETFIGRVRQHAEFGKRLVFLEGASDEVLEYAYRHASALIEASAGEGFGLPLVEAGCYSLPVICSDIPVFHEVAGENALYFNREGVELEEIVRTFSAKKAAGKLPDSGRIDSLSWRESARKVANMILGGADWYKIISIDGSTVDVVEVQEIFLDIPKPDADQENLSENVVAKSILLVHPNNFLRGGQGENNRTLSLVKLIKELGYQVDLLSFESFSPDSSFATFEQDNRQGLIRHLYLYDFKKGYKEEKTWKMHFTVNEGLHDWTRPGMHVLFQEILEENDYAAVGIFYTYLANLLNDTTVPCKKIYFMEDSMFLQQHSWELADKQAPSLGQLMDEELQKINYFDEFFCISYDEKVMYEKLSGRKMYFLPHIMPENTRLVETPVETRKWDVGFVGFHNQFNVDGLQWFIDKVCPLLTSNVKAVFVGSATKGLTTVPPCAEVIPYAPSLEELFDNVKIAICPMLQGTGMKVKVVEAMARGIPVVCNSRGVDGFPDKMACGCIVTDDPREFADSINRLVSDPAFYAEKTEQIRQYYKQLFDRKQYAELLDKVLSQ